MRPRAALACFLLLASLYLFYLPHAQFVIDDWFMLQHFEQARVQGPQAEWKLAGVLAESELWGTFRVHWLSLLTVYALYHLGGLHPWFYFLLGVMLQGVAAWLLYRVLARLDLDPRAAFLAGALFLLLPTAHNPLFWFPSAGQYVLFACWFLLYLHSVAGTVMSGKLRPRDAVFQAVTLALALFSTDQGIGLLLAAALWMAVCWRSRAALKAAALAWAAAAVAGGIYARFINTAPIGGSVAARFRFSLPQAAGQLRGFLAEYWRLLGLDGGYYRVRTIGWGSLAVVLVAGLFVFWCVHSGVWGGGASAFGMAPLSVSRFLLFGAGLWAAAYGPVWLMFWSTFRYDYLPSIGLAIALAAACAALLGRSPGRLFPAGAALLVAWCAGTALAEIRQCWTPQSQNLRSIEQQLRGIKDLRYHDIIALASVPLEMGTAPHFAATSCPYSSVPFAEMVTGVSGLLVGREIFCEDGRLALQLNSMHELERDDLRRTHVIDTTGDLTARVRTLLACQVAPGAYELYPLKDYAGSPPIESRVYSHDELRGIAGSVYLAHRHHRQTEGDP